MSLFTKKSTGTGATPLNNGKPFGIDVSRYQGTIQWNVVAAHVPKVHFAGIRATVSWGYKDPEFDRNWQEAKRVGVLRMAYHVVYPGESIIKQADHFVGALNGDYGELPPVLDLELDHGYSKSAITKNVLALADLIQQRVGRKPVFYSRASWIDQFMDEGSWRNQYDWWLANYLSSTNEHPGPPLLPKGLDAARVYFHQSTNKGVPIGVESAALDYDRWLKSQDALYQYAQTTPVEDPVEEPPTNPGGQTTMSPWPDYAIGAEVKDAAEIPALVADGVSFVIGTAGGVEPGTKNYQWINPKWAAIVQAAYDAGIPILGRWNPTPAIPGRTEQAVVDEQLPYAIWSLRSGFGGVKAVAGFMINGLLYTDIDGKTATDSNITHTVTWIADGVMSFFKEKGRETPVFLRTNHFYIRDNAPALDPIMKNYRVLLAHPEYRMKAQNNAHYPIPRAATKNIAEIRAHLRTLPDGWSNPFVPTNSDFWFWGIGEFPHQAVTYSPYWVLYNGTKDALYQRLGFVPAVTNPDPGTGDPGTGDPGTGDPGTGDPGSSTGDAALLLRKLEAAARAFLDTD